MIEIKFLQEGGPKLIITAPGNPYAERWELDILEQELRPTLIQELPRLNAARPLAFRLLTPTPDYKSEWYINDDSCSSGWQEFLGPREPLDELCTAINHFSFS